MFTDTTSPANLAQHSGDYTIFGLAIICAIVLGLTPLKAPFQWLEVYYHELSHGLAAILTGGRIGRIKLNLNGSGWCSTRGGNRFFILIMGYTGASLWGAYLYLAGWHLGTNYSMNLVYVELVMLGIATLFWVRDIITLAIMAATASSYALPLFVPELIPFTAGLMKFLGIYVMLNAIRAPLHLIDGKHEGDGAALADMTLIFREGFWISFWFTFAIFALGFCAVQTLPGLKPVWYGFVDFVLSFF